MSPLTHQRIFRCSSAIAVIMGFVGSAPCVAAESIQEMNQRHHREIQQMNEAFDRKQDSVSQRYREAMRSYKEGQSSYPSEWVGKFVGLEKERDRELQTIRSKQTEERAKTYLEMNDSGVRSLGLARPAAISDPVSTAQSDVPPAEIAVEGAAVPTEMVFEGPSPSPTPKSKLRSSRKKR
jgi:hypothetical protein